jgi:hypothetical protein
MIEDLSSSFFGLSDCFLSLTIGSAHSLLSFTVRSSTTIVTSWDDNLEPAMPGQLLSDTKSIAARDIFAFNCIQTNQVYT